MELIFWAPPRREAGPFVLFSTSDGPLRASKEGTYSYGHPDNSSGTIATTAHFTVVPVTKGGKDIYNIHDKSEHRVY